MAIVRHLANAPITEALIDLRVQPQRPLEDAQFSALQEALAARYPKAEPIHRVETKIEVSEGKLLPVEPVEARLGWLFRSPDGLQAAQFRSDGFTFNRFKPYTAWEELFPQAMELWRLYVDVVKPDQVGRVAVRFINRMPRYEPIGSFGLVAGPRVPTSTGLTTREFLSRLVLFDEETQGSAILTQASDGDWSEASPAVILDIDAFSERLCLPGDPDIEVTLAMLRELKNKLFFASLEEETARLYE